MAGILMTDPGFGRGHTLGVTDPDQGTSVTGTQKTSRTLIRELQRLPSFIAIAQ